MVLRVVCFACRMGLPWPCRCQPTASGPKEGESPLDGSDYDGLQPEEYAP